MGLIEIGVCMKHQTYDILNVGKNNRFFVRNKQGTPMCVHNCGYGMSADKFNYRMRLTGNLDAADMADEVVSAYRTKNNMIVAFWYECNRVLDTLYAGGSCWFGGPNRNIFYADGSSEFNGVKIPSIRLPNGTHIWYQNLRKEVSVEDNKVNYVYDQFKGRSWLAKRIWGSALVENLCQSLSFAILKYQAIEIAKKGVPINLNVHDEWVSIVHKDQLSKAAVVHYLSMKDVPDYLPAGLLDCEVDVGYNYADLRTLDVAKFIKQQDIYEK